MLVLQDVTQYKELDKMKSDFMAAVSHEFRTPLTSINMGVDLLRQQLLGPLTKAQEELLNSAKQDCNRLTKLVRELLQLSKLESGKIELREEIVDIRKVLDSALPPLQLPFQEKGVLLTLSLRPDLPALLGLRRRSRRLRCLRHALRLRARQHRPPAEPRPAWPPPHQ